MRDEKGRYIKGHKPDPSWLQKWPKGVDTTCANCHKTFLATPNAIANGRRFCIKQCADVFKTTKVVWRKPKSELARSYSTLHNWVRKNYGNHPEKCEACGLPGRFNVRRWTIEWANVSGRYLRERSDWAAVCPKCHVFYLKTQKTVAYYDTKTKQMYLAK